VSQAAATMIAAVHEGLSQVATQLYSLDSDPDVAFVRTLASAPGSAASAKASAIAASADQLWQLYPLAKERVDDAESALQRHDAAGFDRAMATTAITFSDGSTTSPAQLIAWLRSQAETVMNDARALAASARSAIAAVDAASAALRALEDQAGQLGVADAPELATARAAVDKAGAAVAADPTAPPPTQGLDQLLDQCRKLVGDLGGRRAALPAALAAAAQQLAEIEDAVRRGVEAMAATRTKILDPSGLLEPIDPAAVDGGERALRPWLDRIRVEAGDGHWHSASVALDGWKRVADGVAKNAREVAAANAAPLDRRNELRGLLDAYRAKAAAVGQAENGELAQLHEQARQALYVSPCDLAVAERLVASYVEGVNATTTAGGR
jgi:hypothetical protein